MNGNKNLLRNYKIIKTSKKMVFDSKGSITVNEVAEKLNICPKYLSKLYKENRGFRIQKLRDGIRWLSILELGKEGKKLTEIAAELNMTRRNLNYLIRNIKKRLS